MSVRIEPGKHTKALIVCISRRNDCLYSSCRQRLDWAASCGRQDYTISEQETAHTITPQQYR